MSDMFITVIYSAVSWTVLNACVFLPIDKTDPTLLLLTQPVL